jgi:small subunit ribosomal protein S1
MIDLSSTKTHNPDDFNWEVVNGRNPNTKLKRIRSGSKIYCHESYAQEILDIDNNYFREVPENMSLSKDIDSGNVYRCKIVSVTETEALAQTSTGQTIYIDLEKERKDADKLKITGISFNPGDELQAKVRKNGEVYTGSVVEYYIYSLRVELFEQIKKEANAYTVKIESINKGGYIVDLSGIKCFLPGSLAAANRITDFESYIGKELPVMIEGYVEGKDIFIVSYKKYLNRIMESKIQELDLTKKYKGYVTGTSDFGIFVEWEDVYTGLIHKTEFSEDNSITGINPGDEIEFYVKEIKDNNRLTLTLEKPLERNVIIHDLDKQIKDGTCEPIKAKIKHKRKNGILIDLVEFGLMALIPQERIGKKTKDLKPGDDLLVTVYEVEPASGKIFAEPVNDRQ